MNQRNGAVVWVGVAILLSGSQLRAQDHGNDTNEEQSGGQQVEEGQQPVDFDPSKMSDEDFQKMMETMFKIPGGDEQREHLERFVGSWETKTRTYMAGPQGPPMESAGTSTIKWVLGGRYIMEEHRGSMMGQPYEGIGLTGYDDEKNLYVAVWANNLGAELLTMEGTRHPKTGVVTMYGKMDEPMLKMYGRMVKYVTTIIDKDTHKFEVYDLAAGDDYKVVEVMYKRKGT